jgi:hypothetical protein
VYAGAAEVLPIVDSDLRKIAARVADSAKQLCIKKSVIISIFVSFILNFQFNAFSIACLFILLNLCLVMKYEATTCLVMSELIMRN